VSCAVTAEPINLPFGSWIRDGGGWRWALISPHGVAPSRIVGVSASVNLPLHHKVQKFSSGTGSPRWSQKKGSKMVVVWCGGGCVFGWAEGSTSLFVFVRWRQYALPCGHIGTNWQIRLNCLSLVAIGVMSNYFDHLFNLTLLLSLYSSVYIHHSSK